jgi:flagellar biosynthesis protein FlhF
MRLRRFEGDTVAEALARVRADLGADAVILHARTAGASSPSRWAEVTAAVDETIAPEGASAGREAQRRGRGAGVNESRDPADSGHAFTPPNNGRGAPPTSRPLSGERITPHLLEADGTAEALEDIRRLLREVKTEIARVPRLPASVRPAYHQLLSQEVPADLAREILLAFSAERRARQKPSRPVSVQEALARRFRVSGAIAPGRAQRAVVLVGPTGVGKSTTLAKLAGQLRHIGGLSVSLLSLDTYRIGAIAQMQIYADLLRVPLHVIRTADEMRTAVAAERGADLLLVDTMGRSPHQAEGISAIRCLLREIPHAEVHLVLSATTKASDLIEILQRFRPLQYRRVLVTKVDEARALGPVLGLALTRGLTISYLGTGQEVPDHLEVATAQRLAALLVPDLSPSGTRDAASTPRCLC